MSKPDDMGRNYSHDDIDKDYEQARADRAPKPDDAKPDALESLGEVRDICASTAGMLFLGVTLDGIIAAWEKERADVLRENPRALRELAQLRRAVEKVRDELRKSGDENDQRMADALDAALRGKP